MLAAGCQPSMEISAPSSGKKCQSPPQLSAGGGSGWEVVLLPQHRQCKLLFSSPPLCFYNRPPQRAPLHPLNSPAWQKFCSARAAQEITAFFGGRFPVWLCQHPSGAADKEEKRGGTLLGCVWGGGTASSWFR